MPLLLTARHWPQTLLLTALFLLIAAAAAMLACGPVAPPTPADDGALPAAQQSDGEGETPAEVEKPTVEPNAGDSTKSPEKSGANSDPYSDMPTPILDPTQRYPNLTHDLDWIAVEAEDAQGPSGQSEPPPKIQVVIWTYNNPDHTTTKTLVRYLKEQGITPTSINPRAEGFGDGTLIRAFVPATMLGPITQQEGVIGIRGTAHEQPDLRPEPDRLSP